MKSILLGNESKDKKTIENFKTNNINLALTKKEKQKSPLNNEETIENKNELKNNHHKNEQIKKKLINLINRYIPKNNNNNKLEKDEENENSFLNNIDNKDIEKLIYY